MGPLQSTTAGTSRDNEDVGDNVVVAASRLDPFALHNAINELESLTEVVNLVSKDPSLCDQLDHEQQRPIDVVTTKLMMSEEFQKYGVDEEKERAENLWEITRILMVTMGNLPQDDVPFLHAVAKVWDRTPMYIIVRGVKRYAQQLKQFDANGDLPLHVVAREFRPEASEQFLPQLLRVYPAAAKVKSQKEEKLPLQIAVESGRTWEEGIRSLIELYPEGIMALGLDLSMYPYLFHFLAKEKNVGGFQMEKTMETTTLYRLIRSTPDLFTVAS